MDALRKLSWHKLPLRLRNRRNAYAREHPLFIFKGVLKFACHLSDPPLQVDYLYHPVGQSLPGRIARGQAYDLEVVLPVADEATVIQFAENIRRQLERQPRNFEVERIGPVEQRTLADLEHALVPSLDLAADEVCLEFTTPLVFNPLDPARPWLLTAETLVDLCAVHLARLYPTLPWPLGMSADGLRVLPYYWENETIWHQSKSPSPSGGHKGRQKVEGFAGPLYLRGEWQRLLPLLLVCSELHTGYGRGDLHGLESQRFARNPIANPQGAFHLRTGRTFFDRLLKDPSRFVGIAHALAQDSDAAQELAESLDGRDALARTVAAAVASGAYTPAIARLFAIEKNDGGARTIALLGAADLIAQRTLHSILAPVCNRMFEHSSIGYRAGYSVNDARRIMNEAIAAGAAYAVRADIESFFDALDWDVLGLALRRALPRGDRRTLTALEQCIRMPAQLKGAPVPRTTGVLQGSPLSSLLANLCLDTFDEEMLRLGHKLIRYGDDFVVLSPTREEAEQALADINRLLAPLKLWLNPAKTAVTPLDLGFSFLGLDVPSALSEETVLRTALRKALFIKRPYAFTGIDGDSIVIRKDDALLARLPIHRIGEIIFFGDGAVSTRLLQRCARQRIPVSFCSPAGWYLSTLKPDSKAWFGIVAAHCNRHQALGENGRLEVARRVVEAKLRNYAAWLRSLASPEAKQGARAIIEIVECLNSAATLESLRGYEGSAARLTFALVNRLVARPGFGSPRRIPREKPDRFNALLDMLYSLLFTRLNVLLRSAGLNPYLGFLHSPLDHYESLVCDLQEPFRCRIDRLALKLIHRQQLDETSFESGENSSSWRLTSDAVGITIEAFEREEQVRAMGKSPTLVELLAGQVSAVRRWVEGSEVTPAVYLAEEARSGKTKKSDRIKTS